MAVTHNMRQSTVRHVCLTVWVFFYIKMFSNLFQIFFAIGDVSFSIGASISIGQEIRRPLYAGFHFLICIYFVRFYWAPVKSNILLLVTYLFKQINFLYKHILTLAPFLISHGDLFKHFF